MKPVWGLILHADGQISEFESNGVGRRCWSRGSTSTQQRRYTAIFCCWATTEARMKFP